MKNHFAELSAYCAQLPIINTHSHYISSANHAKDGLLGLLQQSYVSWCGMPFGDAREGMDAIHELRGNTYFVWFEKALQKLCGIKEPISEDSWDAYDAQIRRLFSDATYPYHVLKNLCGYERILFDAYWNPGSDEGCAALFAPAYRINMFLFGYSISAQDHNGHNPFEVCGFDKALSFDECLGAVDRQIAQKKAQGCVALKCAIAYDRGLDFERTDKAQAAAAYMNPSATHQQIKHFGDYVFYRICQAAATYELPMQIHTGLGKMHKTNAMQLLNTIEDNPNTQFVLFHGSYPWTQDVCGLVHNYKNVYADLCWLPLISTTACEKLLYELIEVGGKSRIMWGCDTWHSVESLGAAMAIKHVLCKVFSRRIGDGLMDMDTAKDYIRHILYENAKKLFGL